MAMIWANNKQWIIRTQKIYTIDIYYDEVCILNYNIAASSDYVFKRFKAYKPI